jgi:hypothetical protein
LAKKTGKRSNSKAKPSLKKKAKSGSKSKKAAKQTKPLIELKQIV